MNCRAPAHLCLETPGALEARKGCRAGEGGVARAHSRLGSRSRVTSAPASPNPKLTGTLPAPGTRGPGDPGTPPPPHSWAVRGWLRPRGPCSIAGQALGSPLVREGTQFSKHRRTDSTWP